MASGKTLELVNGRNNAARSLAVLAVCCFLGMFAFALRGVTESPAAAPLSWDKTSEQGIFAVTLDARATTVALREFLEWTVEVRDAHGDPIYPARFAIGGGMPGHGHGLPSQPRVTEHLAGGKYVISGLKFNMAGNWVLLFDIETAAATDRVSFEFQIDY
jgi:hypothetical protein